MPIITKEQVRKAIGLGTLNPKVINDFFYDIKLKSYDYDYKIQQDLIDLTSVENSFWDAFKKSMVIKDAVRDGKLDRVCVVQIDKDIVHYAKRKEYKLSKKYNKPLALKDIMANRDIFKFGVLCFINGKMNLNFKIQAREDKTFILFPRNDFAKTIKETDVIDTVFIPECVIYSSRNLSSQDKPDAYSLSTFIFEDFNEKHINECNGFIAFLNPINGSEPIFHTDVQYDSVHKKFVFKSALPAKIENFNCTIVGMERYLQSIDITADTKYLQIDRKPMPIPKDNLLIMIRDDNGYSYHVNTGEIQIKEYYPNIYEVINPEKRVAKIVVLYADNPRNELLDYDCEIEYYLSKVNLLDRYKEATVPNGLKDYEPIDWNYLISDYEETSGIITPTGNPWFPFLYKLNKISSIYKLWATFFQTYLERTYGYLDGWTLDVSTIDLAPRYRVETLPELTVASGHHMKFKTPQYLFTYRNDFGNEENVPYAWFIDGKFTVPTFSVSYHGYQFVYFDAKAIKEDSIIEVERYDGNVWTQKVHVGEGVTEVTLKMIDRPLLANSIFLTDDAGNYIDFKNAYNVSIIDHELGEYEYHLDMDKSVFILEKDSVIRLTPISSEYKNKDIQLHCNNRSVVFNAYMNNLGLFDDMNLNISGTINRVKQNILPRLRVFSPEGRLYPKFAYSQIENKNIEEVPNFSIMASPNQGTPFKIEYMGYEEEIVYNLEEIPENGFLDLEGKLDKPFSLVYHEVFLNGYKLNKNQIEIIAPYHIALKNINTRSRLIIYERIKGEEIFRFEPNEASQYIADRLIDLDPTYYEKLLQDLTDIVVDPNIPNMDDEIDVTIGLIKDFLAVNFLNADVKYPPEMFDIYEMLFPGDQWRYYMNADDRVRLGIPSKNWFYINHDSNIAYNGK